MKFAILALFLVALAATSFGGETKAQRDARMKWWREARFGMFIHWGLYAVPAGAYKGKTSHGEWIMESGQVPLAEYEAWRDQFNPTKFDAADWARMAKDAGMKYVVITTKHHDGFTLYPSEVSDWDIMSTPFKRDIMKELSDAVRKEGLVQCWYHSIMDWHHPDYVPHRAWAQPQPADTSFDRFEKYLHAQVSEILTKYGPIGVMWFDGEWERTWNHERGARLDALCRKLQPNVIVNNRVDVGRGGMAGFSDYGYCGDFGTPEQEVPAKGVPGVDWESCITMNGHWGYNAADKNFKSSKELIQMLVDIASKGGNFLLNVGPRADGTFPQESIDRLRDMGAWMKVNGDAIYGTTASPFENLPFGRCTAKAGKSSTKLFLHVFNWPKDGKLIVPGIGNESIKARAMGSNGTLKVTRKQSDVSIDLSGVKRDPFATVIELTVPGKAIIYTAPEISSTSDIFVGSAAVSLSGSGNGVQVRYTTDGSAPTLASPLYKSSIKISKTTTIKARCFHNGKAVTSVSSKTLKLVKPWSSVSLPSSAVSGISRSVVMGSFEKVPVQLDLSDSAKNFVTEIGTSEFGNTENVLLIFEGYLNVPADGLYSFALNSDDGSMLWIDGNVAVNNDGLHGPEEKVGHVPLAKGHHKVKLAWFNATGGAALDLRWREKSGRFVEIPAQSWKCAP